MKWKNYGLWISIASILYMVLRDIGYDIDLTKWQTYVTAILGILATLGVISNPEQGRGYYQRKAKTGNTQQIKDVVETVVKNQENDVSEMINSNNSTQAIQQAQEHKEPQNSNDKEEMLPPNENYVSPSENYVPHVEDTPKQPNLEHELTTETEVEMPPRVNIGERLPYEK